VSANVERARDRRAPGGEKLAGAAHSPTPWPIRAAGGSARSARPLRRGAGMHDAPDRGMTAKIRIGFPLDEAMRAEHGEAVVRPVLNVYEDYDPADVADHGPHVDRVGLVAVDSDFDPPGGDADPRPRPLRTRL
jgi:hypothetical protein